MILIVILVVCFFVYILCRQVNCYVRLKKCGLKPIFDIFGVTGLSWLSSSRAHSRFVEKSVQVGSKTFSMMRGAHPVVVTNDVELIHSISSQFYNCFHSRIQEIMSDNPVTAKNVHMFAARGERWKRLRTITSYGLANSKLKELFPIVENCVAKFIQYMESMANAAEMRVDDLHRLFQNHTSYVLVQCAYGYEEKSHKDNQFLSVFQEAFGVLADYQYSIIEKLLYFVPEIKFIFKLPLISSLSANLNRARFLNYLLQLIDTFCQQFNEPSECTNNVLKYSLLKYFYEHNNNQQVDELDEEAFGEIDMKKTKVDKIISAEEISAQCKFLSVAGFDTTANTLTILFYLLAHNPQIQEQLYRDEIGVAAEDVRIEDLCSMTLLQNCILECLRCFPHASPLQHRICTQKCQIGDYQFEPEFEVILNPWGPHRDKSIWGEDVDCFNPHRFENLSDAQKRAFMPFGVGPRQCAGMRFALLELRTTIFRILRKFSVMPLEMPYDCNGDKISMTVRDTGTIWPNDKVRVIFRRRTAFQ